jgi:multidrug efflux pump subunit AcrA (membrane-fusion protein)
MSRRRAQSTVRWVLTAAVGVGAVVGIATLVLRYARPSVVVTEAVEGPVVSAFYSTGTIQPEREYPIKSNTAGILTKVLVDKGDHVTRDQPLAIVSDPALTYAKDKAHAELDEKLARADDKHSPVLREFDDRMNAAKDMLELAQREEQRLREASEQHAASPMDLDRASQKVKELWSLCESLKSQRAAKKLELDREVEVAKSALNTAQWNCDQQTLKSPIDGVVLDRPIAVGTRVAINDPVMRVANVLPENLVMRAQVDEEDVAKVNVGQTVRLTLYAFNDRGFTGTVSRIYDQADPERRTFEIDVRLTDRNARLQPGMTGELAFILSAKDKAIVVPAQALQGGNLYTIVDGHLNRIENAQIGLKSVERIEVLSGVNVGDRVAISPVAGIEPGKPVRTSYIDPATAAGLNKPKVATDGFKGFK